MHPITRRQAGAMALAGFGLAACATSPDQLGPTEASPVQGVRFRMVQTNGIRLRVAEMGTENTKAPLVVLAHGWPESWYSWRHQIPAIAAAGYRVIAPDMRGYGGSDRPPAIEDYDITHTSGDIVGLLDAYGAEKAVLIGHDWGAIVTWNTVLLHPDRFSAMVAMSVPNGGRAASPPLTGMRAAAGENFQYIVYANEPGGLAEKEYDSNPRGLLSGLYTSKDTPVDPPAVTDPKRSAGGWIPRLGKPKALPPWLTQADLDYFVSQFQQAGFRGGVNYYRNFDRNWEITPQLAGARIKAPVAFIAGVDDVVIRGAKEDALRTQMSRVADDLRDVKLVPGAGHWVQQEKPQEVNDFVLDFLAKVMT
ncbi:MAG TPA: alpha/beta hydrolase [Hyphomonadaceae bacterium]|nr:alpha/beta hydrolase [Hyphomonadaceae bacterium]